MLAPLHIRAAPLRTRSTPCSPLFAPAPLLLARSTSHTLSTSRSPPHAPFARQTATTASVAIRRSRTRSSTPATSRRSASTGTVTAFSACWDVLGPTHLPRMRGSRVPRVASCVYPLTRSRIRFAPRTHPIRSLVSLPHSLHPLARFAPSRTPSDHSLLSLPHRIRPPHPPHSQLRLVEARRVRRADGHAAVERPD